MKNLKYFFFLLFIFLILLGLLTGSILYLRPDVKPEDFLTDWKYWIVPIALMYVVFNFKNILKSVFNRILLVGMFLWSGYYFFPGVMNFVKPYVSNPISSNTAKNTFNELVTPKDGTKPIVHIDNTGLKYNPESRDVKVSDLEKNKNPSPNSNSTPNSLPDTFTNDLNNKNVSNLSNEQISQLSNQPLSYISKMTSLAPPEVKDRLARIGINMDNPQQTISNLVGSDSKKQRQAINQIFK